MNERRQKIYDVNIEIMDLLCPNYTWANSADNEPTCMLIRELNCIKVDFYPHTGKWKYTKNHKQYILMGGAAEFIKWYNEHRRSIEMTDETKQTIDNMNYTSMLALWRFAHVGHPYFRDETGNYFNKIMKEKRDKITDEEHTRISKQIGWNK